MPPQMSSFNISPISSADSGFRDDEPLDLSCNRLAAPRSDSVATRPQIQASDSALVPVRARPSMEPLHNARARIIQQLLNPEIRNEPSQFECNLCGRGYRSAVQYKAHIRRHKSKKNGTYSCKVCQKNFAQRSSLKTHERIHTGEKPHYCDACHERFGDFSTFTKHRRTHSGEKPYGCPVCGQTFSQSGNMRRHLKVTHKTHLDAIAVLAEAAAAVAASTNLGPSTCSNVSK